MIVFRVLLPSILCLFVQSIYAIEAKFNVRNPFPTSIEVAIYIGGVENYPLTGKVVGRTTIQPKMTELVNVQGLKKREILTLIVDFENGTRCRYWTGMVEKNRTYDISINSDKIGVEKSPEEYIDQLMTDLYKSDEENFDFIVEYTNTRADAVAQELFGALAIIEVTRDGSELKVNEVDHISSSILGNAIEIKYNGNTDEFKYTLSGNMATENAANIPGFGEIAAAVSNEKTYTFEYSMLGFGKTIHTFKDESIQSLWSKLSTQEQENFLTTYIASIDKVKGDSSKEIEVRVLNRLIGFKGMYLKVEEFHASGAVVDLSASTFYENGTLYSRSVTGEKGKVYDEYILAIGCKGENKTAMFNRLAQEYLAEKVKDFRQDGKIDTMLLKTLPEEARFRIFHEGDLKDAEAWMLQNQELLGKLEKELELK